MVRYLLLAYLVHGYHEFASNGILNMVLADKRNTPFYVCTVISNNKYFCIINKNYVG